MTRTIDQHMERYLGPIARGWGSRVGESADVQVCLFEECPIPGTVTYATLGLSRHVLKMPQGREVRQELLLSVSLRFADENRARLLAHIADNLVHDHQALLRGEVFHLGFAVAPGSPCTGLYIALPVVFPDALATYPETQPPTVFPWLIPVHRNEAALVARLGWDAFEDRLEHADPDLFDLTRPSIA
ncbi:suppressor of fused domain protein [Chondromyces crocatus]|uniref:suppressor of fused domain protein n=1 Tax=Chondromyces crocatus TaxID=52 RepID=UPI00146FFA61|nr:suppressor of fused domain protein [Chondromyces crocatus]